MNRKQRKQLLEEQHALSLKLIAVSQRRSAFAEVAALCSDMQMEEYKKYNDLLQEAFEIKRKLVAKSHRRKR